eukprot:gene3019-3771_t
MHTPLRSVHVTLGRLPYPVQWLLLILSILLFVVRCAKIEELEGGPKDTTPPKLKTTYPAHGSTGFNGQKIQLIFDKEVEIQDIYNRLIITPKLEKRTDKPSYTTKTQGNKVELHLAVPLAPETTYTFSFTDAICDTKERTAAENPVLTFSTGDSIDTLCIGGKINYLMTNKPAANALVGLYKVTTPDTAHILNSNPDYFTRTNQEGTFKIEHIKPGPYKICAGYSESEKRRLILDSDQDFYGFLPSPIALSESLENIDLSILQANIAELSIQSTQAQGTYFEIHFNRPIQETYTLQLKGLSKRTQHQLFSHLAEKNQVIRVYNTMGLLENETLEASLLATDDRGNEVNQTVRLRFKNTAKKEPFRCTIQPNRVPACLSIDITANKPMKNIYADNIYLLINQVDTLFLTSEDITQHPLHDAITIRKQVDTDINTAQGQLTPTNIALHIPKGAFISVEKEQNESLTYQYVAKNPTDYGRLSGQVTTQSPGFIIQLLNDKYEVVEAIRNQSHYKFETITPGIYTIRVLLLDKQHGMWHCGNINQSIPPNPVIFYPHELNIAANWSLEDINLSC